MSEQLATLKGMGLTVLMALLLVQAGSAGTSQEPAKAGLAGKLYKSVFLSGSGALKAADAAALSEPLKSRLETFLARRAAFKSRYESQPDDIDKVRADAKRRDLERAIVALIDAPGIEKMAAELVAAAPIAAEWGNKPDGPLAEASFAEHQLKKAPSSPLAPWLYVFIAQRQRVAFEASEHLKDEAGMRAAAKKYRAFVERARAAADPIYASIVDDMERQPFLYLKTAQHPRDYAPDS